MRFLLPSFLTASIGLVSALSVETRGDTRKRAAYILSNNPEGNNLLALSISTKDGTVSNPVLTPTGGKGLLGLTANGTAGPDGLFSQGAVTVSGHVSLSQTTISPNKTDGHSISLPSILEAIRYQCLGSMPNHLLPSN